MNIVVLNGSPAGRDSITLFTLRYIRKHFPEHHYRILHVGQQIRKMEAHPEIWREPLKAADLVLFCYPVYTFLAPAQLQRFIGLMKESGIDLSGKTASQITTSKHFYDVTAHRFIEENCADMGMKSVRGLSADMEDLLHPKGQRDALAYFRYLLWNMEGGQPPAGAPKRVVIVADFPDAADHRLQAMCERLKNRLPCETEIVNLQEYPFAGGCLGCFSCAADGTCVYHDGFDSWLRETVQSADALVYAFTIRDHSMGYRFKLFDDRQFCNGHRTVTMGKPVGYLVDGDLDAEPNLKLLLEARAEVGGNMPAGFACSGADQDRETDRLADTLCYAAAEHYMPPANFYGVGGMKIFRDLIWQMQGLMREDHRFYRKHGLYDFPQKRRGTMLAMYLAGGLMRRPKLRKKLGGKITEAMTRPYRKVVGEEEAPED